MIGLFTLILILGMDGLGIYFGIKNISKISNSINNQPKLPINKVISANSLMQKDDPQNRNSYGFSCEYSTSILPNAKIDENGQLITQLHLLMSNDNWRQPYLNNINQVDNVIICALLDSSSSSTPTLNKLNNNFPLIIFNDINNDLVNKGLDPTEGITNQEKITEIKLTYESKARKAAKIISDKLLNYLSFAGELVNLDAIVFHKYVDAIGSLGIYDEKYKNTSLEPWWSNRTLNLFIIPSVTTEKDGSIFRGPGYVPFDIEELGNISFDLYEIYNTLAHEYGHHVTLHNGLFNSQNFLDELKKVFFEEGNNKAFNDFVEMYKYFNSINTDETLNYQNLNGDLVLNEGAKNTLKLWRKYYSYNVRSVYDLVENNPFGFTKIRVINNIIDSLNKRKTEGMVNPILLDYLNELVNGVETNKEKLKNYYLYYYNHNDVNKALDNNGEDVIYNVKFWYMSNSYKDDLDTDRSTQLKVSDIFPNIKVVDWKMNTEIENTYCLDLGYNFHGDIFNRERLYNTKFTTESEFNLASITTDKKTLSYLQYYFSASELLARMYAVLTYKHLDKRSYIDQCSLDAKSQYLTHKALFLKNRNFEDYGFFRSFGMNLLKNNNERTLYKMLTHKQDLSNNQGHVYQNEIIKNSNNVPNPNLPDEVPYSLSSKIVLENGRKQLNGFANVHFIINLKLNNPEDAFLIKLQYENNDPITPFFYDYDNSQLVVNDINDNIENTNNIHLTSFFSSASEAKKHVSLVFKLLEILGTITDSGYLISSSLNGKTVSYEVLKEKYKWINENNKPTLFIDKNYNNIFDDGDIKIDFN